MVLMMILHCHYNILVGHPRVGHLIGLVGFVIFILLLKEEEEHIKK